MPSPSPPPQASPLPIPSSPDSKSPGRRTSFGFLHRSRSKEPIQNRKVSGAKITKKHHEQAREEELRRLKEAGLMPGAVPTLPLLTPSPQLQRLVGEGATPDRAAGKNTNPSMEAPTRTVPIPPIPRVSQSPDPYSRSESITHRGRYSYAASAVSSIDSPRRVRRRKDPTPYNVLVVGARNSGKTSFINFLRISLAAKKRLNRPGENVETPIAAKTNKSFVHHYLETEIDGERVGLTLWDSQGLEKNVVDLQLREMSTFIESKFEDTFSEEMKVVRAPGVQDTHIHCVFLILDPVRLDANIQAARQHSSTEKTGKTHNTPERIIGALDEDFDLQVLRTLRGKTSVVPVISKADTITTAHMAVLKNMVHDGLKMAGLDPLEALSFEEEEESDEEDNAIVDKFDERDEDEANARNKSDSPDSEDGRGSPHTSDSDTVPQDQPTPVVLRRSSLRPKPVAPSGTSEEGLIDPPYLPYSILSPDEYSLASKDGRVGRKFPWGFADPYDPEHCDFTKLKETCFGEWRAELREASKEIWYERWRTSRLNRQGISANGTSAGSRTSNGLSKGAPR
ncbi:hypothetical protein GJ744_007096 [Endocarpon pusillum]|uniref:Septin-type G domain-containing protein n=1 Tax=Endocarpon pusillum TaxID=364733 RepID=A0A8H7A6A3_9EURO|nr:hypothetical protein GJ744_007096 [Endocarpon pusillum]